MTGILGTANSQLGNIELGALGSTVTNATPSSSLNQSQTAVGLHFSSWSPSNTLTQTESATEISGTFESASNTLSQTSAVAIEQYIHNDGCTLSYIPVGHLAVTHIVNVDADNSIVWISNGTDINEVDVDSSSALSQTSSVSVKLKLKESVTNTLTQTESNAVVPTTHMVNLLQQYHTLTVGVTLNVTATQPTLVWKKFAGATRAKPTDSTYSPVSTVAYTKSYSTQSTYTLSQTPAIVIGIVSNVSAINLYTPTQVMFDVIAHSHVAFNGFGMNDFVKVWKEYDLSLSNTITWNQSLVHELFNESITKTIVWTQTVVCKHVIPVIANNLYSPVTTAVKKGSRVFSLSNTLNYLNTHLVYVPLSNVNLATVPNLIYTLTHPLAVGSDPVYFMGSNGVPLILIPQSTKKSPAYCTLQVPQRAITLPAPEFNDSEAYSGIFTIRRSMIGSTVTYVHRLNTSKLKYEFLIGVPKMMELESYLLLFNSQVHYLTNWKGEIWYVAITNNPMEMICKNRYSNGLGDSNDDIEQVSVTLEFEGTRIH